ncbi:MAG: NAD(P)/FAD-dependent oxidoreductase [Deltaproteobacteria bacterium]|nr:NAD(P)/FAD-dependent oxidoreductase [Deltaproteobacteria bacterium]
MADKKYDAVIVGGGHHANILGCYLARAGLKTAMFERWHECGGGACGEELPLPGFIQNVCAHWTRFYTHPAYTDFNLRDFGLVYTFPEYNEGWVYPNGKYMLGKSVMEVVDPLTGRAEWNDGRAQEVANHARHISKHDADVVDDILTRFKTKWSAAFARYRYTGPDDWGELDPLEELTGDAKYGIDPRYAHMTIAEVARDLFDSPELQTFFMRAHQTSHGLMPFEKAGLYWHVHVLGLVLSVTGAAVVYGGSHSIAHALLRAFQAEGGEFFVLSEVEKVLVTNGKASGIRLKNGTEIEADLVISDLSVDFTMDLLGEEYVPRDLWQKIQKLKEPPKSLEDLTGYARTQVLWGQIALIDPPVYPQNQDLGYVPRLYMGPADPEMFFSGDYMRERWNKGLADQLYLLVSPDSQWDPTRAPTGRFAAMVEEFSCHVSRFSEREWLGIKRRVAKKMVEEWGKYAPNVTMDNFIEAHISTPDDIRNRNPCNRGGGWGGLDMDAGRLGRLKPFREINNYRMPVKDYYLCSSAAHNGHGIGRGSGYNCYKAIAKDYGLSYRPWETRAY